MSRKPVVWITRPQPGATQTAAALAEAGYDPVLLPLTEIRACDPGLSADEAAGFDAVAVTSANALRHAPGPLLDTLAGKPVYAVGDATATEARSGGLAAVISAGGAVDDLVSLIGGREKPGASILYLCGSPRTGDLERKLADIGFECRTAEVYVTEIVSYPTEYFRDALNRHAPDAVLFHSGLSAEAFASGVLRENSQHFENTILFALSPRIAATLPQSLKSQIIVAPEPNEPALLAALRETLPPVGN